MLHIIYCLSLHLPWLLAHKPLCLLVKRSGSTKISWLCCIWQRKTHQLTFTQMNKTSCENVSLNNWLFPKVSNEESLFVLDGAWSKKMVALLCCFYSFSKSRDSFSHFKRIHVLLILTQQRFLDSASCVMWYRPSCRKNIWRCIGKIQLEKTESVTT